MPHHHSNFQGRRHIVKADSVAQNLTIAGTFEQPTDAKLYKFLRAHKLRFIMPNGNSSLIEALGPVKRGDFYADWYSKSVDIGVAWTGNDAFYKKHLGAALMEKPSQRLVNLLAVGVPTIGDGRIQSFQDVRRLGLALPGAPEVLLADSAEHLMDTIEKLRVNATLRERVASAGLRIAEELFSPAAIARQYGAFFKSLVEFAY
jgi:glycosyltransferase involved in cell wall biosynthesis